MLLLAFLTALLTASTASAGGLGRLHGRRMLDDGGQVVQSGHDDWGANPPSEWPTTATEPGAPYQYDSGSSEPESNGGVEGSESAETAPGGSAEPQASEPTGAPVDSGQMQESHSTPPAPPGGFLQNEYAFLADAFKNGAIKIVPNRGGENPCHSNSPASTFFGQRYPGYFGGCLETQPSGK